MSLNGAEWGVIARLVYTKLLRKHIIKLVARTDTKIDDIALQALDKAAGYKGGN